MAQRKVRGKAPAKTKTKTKARKTGQSRAGTSKKVATKRAKRAQRGKKSTAKVRTKTEAKGKRKPRTKTRKKTRAKAKAAAKTPAAAPATPPASERRRALSVLDELREAYPDAHVELDYTNALELLVATILAAQCTDKRVNEVTKSLFRKYRTARDYLDAPEEVLQKEIKSTGFFRNKTRSIKNAARSLVERFGGEVPRTMDELLQLAGVGRKTANVLLANAFDTPGIVVDTHMLRLSRRMGFSVNTDAVKVEHDMMALFPASAWIDLSHLIPWHGRRTCKARKPACEECPVAADCPKLI